MDAVGRGVPVAHGPARPGDIRTSCGDPTAAIAALGLRAGVLLRDGLRDTCAALGAWNPPDLPAPDRMP